MEDNQRRQKKIRRQAEDKKIRRRQGVDEDGSFPITFHVRLRPRDRKIEKYD